MDFLSALEITVFARDIFENQLADSANCYKRKFIFS